MLKLLKLLLACPCGYEEVSQLTSADNEQFEAFEEVMSRFQHIIKQHHQEKDFGFTTSQMFILRYLMQSPDAKASDIARASGLSPGAVTQVCDELVKEGLVERTRSVDDRRVVHIQITDSGKDVFDRFREARRARMRAILLKMGQEDAREFVRIFNRVVDILEEGL